MMARSHNLPIMFCCETYKVRLAPCGISLCFLARQPLTQTFFIISDHLFSGNFDIPTNYNRWDWSNRIPPTHIDRNTWLGADSSLSLGTKSLHPLPKPSQLAFSSDTYSLGAPVCASIPAHYAGVTAESVVKRIPDIDFACCAVSVLCSSVPPWPSQIYKLCFPHSFPCDWSLCTPFFHPAKFCERVQLDSIVYNELGHPDDLISQGSGDVDEFKTLPRYICLV